MGKGGGQQSTQSGTTTQERQPTAEETRLNQLDVQLREATNPFTMEIQKAGLGLGTQLLKGDTPLPGWMAGLTEGISPEITQSIVDQSMKDVDYRMAGQGLMDSGTRASVMSRTSGDVRRATEEYNIGNKLNLLNLALTGQAQVQSAGLGYGAQVGQRLSTLGPTTKSFNSTAKNAAMGGGWGIGF